MACLNRFSMSLGRPLSFNARKVMHYRRSYSTQDNHAPDVKGKTGASVASGLHREWIALQQLFGKSGSGTNRRKRSKETMTPVEEIERSRHEQKMVMEDAQSADYNGRKDVVLIGGEDGEQTIWGERWLSLKAWFAHSAPARRVRIAKRTIETSENSVARAYREARESMQEALDDIREVLETSQDPRVTRIRDVSERIFGETEQAFALGELRKRDRDFNLLEFLEDMQDYQIPVVIEAYRRASKSDRLLLSTVTEGQAAQFMFATLKEREIQRAQWDPRILDVRQVDLAKAFVEQNEPYLMLSFVCQHVNCIKHKDKEPQRILLMAVNRAYRMCITPGCCVVILKIRILTGKSLSFIHNKCTPLFKYMPFYCCA